MPASSTSKTSGVVPRSGSCSSGQASAATAVMRPVHAATTVPLSMSPVAPQTIDFSTRPPSSGRPGDQVEDAHDQVGAGQALDGHQQQPVGRHEPQRQRGQPDADRGERPHDRDHQLLARSARLSLDRGGAAEEVEGDRADLVAVVARHVGVGGLVEQHREVEDHREREPGDVLQAAEAGRDLVDARCDDPRDQGGDQEPRAGDEHVAAGDGADLEGPRRALWARPWGGRDGVRDASEGCSDTCRGYPTSTSPRTVGALA